MKQNETKMKQNETKMKQMAGGGCAGAAGTRPFLGSVCLWRNRLNMGNPLNNLFHRAITVSYGYFKGIVVAR
jgi:hypothetical protein